ETPSGPPTRLARVGAPYRNSGPVGKLIGNGRESSTRARRTSSLSDQIKIIRRSTRVCELVGPRSMYSKLHDFLLLSLFGIQLRPAWGQPHGSSRPQVRSHRLQSKDHRLLHKLVGQ